MLFCLCIIDRKTANWSAARRYTAKGVAGLDESRLQQARGAALEAINGSRPSSGTHFPSVEEAVRRAVRSAWKKNVEKRPVVLPVVLEL